MKKNQLTENWYPARLLTVVAWVFVESLEEQTMNMAKATAALLTEKLRHACGAAVECVISDTCIAGMAEAACLRRKYQQPECRPHHYGNALLVLWQ